MSSGRCGSASGATPVLALIAVSVWFLANSREHQRDAEARRLALEAESDSEQKPDSALKKSVRAYDALEAFGEHPLSVKTPAVRAEILRTLADDATSQPFLVTHLKGEGQGVEALATDGNLLWAGENAPFDLFRKSHRGQCHRGLGRGPRGFDHGNKRRRIAGRHSNRHLAKRPFH
jgi:hypothetical protein